MYCQNCGSALNPQTKYCSRCGTHLVPAGEKSLDKTPTEKRLDEHLDSLFWVSVFGLGVIIGGAILLKKTNFSDLVVLFYAVMSSTVFLINFGFSLWRALSVMRSSKEGRLSMQPGQDTRELPPSRVEPISVTENTTRSFEPREISSQRRKDAKEEFKV